MKSSDLFLEYRARIDSELEQTALRIKSEAANRAYVEYTSYPVAKLKIELAKTLKSLGVESASHQDLKVTLPPEQFSGDLSFPVFEFCKEARKPPAALASEVAQALLSAQSPFVETAASAGGYVNISLNRKTFYAETVKGVMSLKERFGESDRHKGESVFIDYSSPNIAKPFGIGHLRSTVIGEALARIYRSIGYTVIRDNHLGDWGTQFGSLIYAYRKWGDPKAIEANPIEGLKSLYVRFSSEAEENPALKDEARRIFSDLEAGNPELVSLWMKFRDLSVEEFSRTYKELNISFDMTLGESYYARGSEALVQDLMKKGIAKEGNDSAIVVEGLNKLPPFLVQKGDGSTLYVLRDAQAIIHRKRVFNPSIVLYVVGVEQELNFKQLFALAKEAGYAGETRLKHVGFGLVLVDGKKMATRKGTLINLSEVMAQIEEKAKGIMEGKGASSGHEVALTARRIALSAVVYNDLRQNRLSDVEFNWEKMLDLSSGSVIYLQYAYARVLSILRKMDADKTADEGPQAPIYEDETEFKLAVRLSLFPDTLLDVAKNDTPHLVCDFLEALAADVNRFYAKVSVMETKGEELRGSRVALLRSILTGMENAFSALNIPVIERL